MSDPITYRPFTHEDIAAAHALTVELKWPHRADDWRLAALLGVGFVAEDASGVIGTALCWKYGADRASLGMVIVSPVVRDAATRRVADSNRARSASEPAGSAGGTG